jgi:hypothetical protein
MLGAYTQRYQTQVKVASTNVTIMPQNVTSPNYFVYCIVVIVTLERASYLFCLFECHYGDARTGTVSLLFILNVVIVTLERAPYLFCLFECRYSDARALTVSLLFI